MKIHFGKSNWEMFSAPLADFTARAAADGFEAVEVFLPSRAETPAEIRQILQNRGLTLVGQIVTEGSTPEEHASSLEMRFLHAVECDPVFVNSQTGRDWFSEEDNLALLRLGADLSKKHGVPLLHETHRGRPTFSAPSTTRLLQTLPDMRITADFSHWFCVHESDLSDQPAAVALACERADYIHARVGFEEGPQIPDPLATHRELITGKFLALWRRILDLAAARGKDDFIVTPEFGPKPYMPCAPDSGQPVADAWALNVTFRNHLASALKADWALTE